MLTGEHLITKRVFADIFVDPQWAHCGGGSSSSWGIVPLRSYTPSLSVHFLGLPIHLKISAFAEAVTQATGVPCLAQDLRLICKDELNPALKPRVSNSLEWIMDGAIDPHGTLRSKLLSTDIIYRGKAYRAATPLAEGEQVFRIMVTDMFVSDTPNVYETLVNGLRAYFRKYGTVARIQIAQDHLMNGQGFFSHNQGIVYLVHSPAHPKLPKERQTAILPEWNNETCSWHAYAI